MERQLEGLDETAIAAIDDELPPRSMALDGLSFQVARRRAEFGTKIGHRRRRAQCPSRPARGNAEPLGPRVGTLAIRLSNLNRREEAVAASQEAVDIYRRLARTRADAFSRSGSTCARRINGDDAFLEETSKRLETWCVPLAASI